MRYKVVISAQAHEDVSNIVAYISEKFGLVSTAKKKYQIIMQVLQLVLPDHPFWQRPYAGNPWHSYDLYVYNVDNYRIIHVPDAASRQTTVIRVLHQSQDVDRQLTRTAKSSLIE